MVFFYQLMPSISKWAWGWSQAGHLLGASELSMT
jgi:hypothetical protein